NKTDLLTVFIAVTSGMMVVSQYGYTVHDAIRDKAELSLLNLNTRATTLARIADPIDREKFCIPMSAFALALDEKLQPEARIFLNGVVGEEDPKKTALYSILRNYLFPRDIEISVDGKASLDISGFEGASCNSTSRLRASGFDLLVEIKTNDSVSLLPL